MDQSTVTLLFQEAIDQGNVAEARNLVTLFETTPEKMPIRIAAYKTIIEASLSQGNVWAAQEAAPFAGIRLQNADYERCRTAAIERRCLDAVVWCTNYIGDKLSVDSTRELLKGDSAFVPNPVEQLRNIIQAHVDLDALSARELLVFWFFQSH